MPDGNSKLGKMSKFFKTHFGSKKNKEKQSNSKSLKVKSKEEAASSQVQKNFNEASKETKSSTWKPIIVANNLEKFEKALKSLNDQKIKSMNSIKAAILYTKIKQIGNQGASSNIKALTKPRPAAEEIMGIIEATEFGEDAQKKLLTAAECIRNASSITWALSVKAIYHAFKSKRGSKIISKLLNTKDNISAQQEKNIIQEQLSPNTAPTKLTPNSSKDPTSSKEVSHKKESKASTPSKPAAPLPKPVAPTRTKLDPVSKVKLAPILKQILDSLVALNSSIKNKDWNSTLPIQSSNIRGVVDNLIAQSKKAGQNVVNEKSEFLKKSRQDDKDKIDKLGAAVTTILNVLDGKQVNSSEQNECISYFEKPSAKDPTEIRFSKEIAVNLNIVFKWHKYIQAKEKMRKTPRGSVRIGAQREKAATLKQTLKDLDKVKEDLDNVLEESIRILKGSDSDKSTDDKAKKASGSATSGGYLWGDTKATDDLMEKFKRMSEQSKK